MTNSKKLQLHVTFFIKNLMKTKTKIGKQAIIMSSYKIPIDIHYRQTMSLA